MLIYNTQPHNAPYLKLHTITIAKEQKTSLIILHHKKQYQEGKKTRPWVSAVDFPCLNWEIGSNTHHTKVTYIKRKMEVIKSSPFYFPGYFSNRPLPLNLAKHTEKRGKKGVPARIELHEPSTDLVTPHTRSAQLNKQYSCSSGGSNGSGKTDVNYKKWGRGSFKTRATRLASPIQKQRRAKERVQRRAQSKWLREKHLQLYTAWTTVLRLPFRSLCCFLDLTRKRRRGRRGCVCWHRKDFDFRSHQVKGRGGDSLAPSIWSCKRARPIYHQRKKELSLLSLKSNRSKL